jgi:hypothetical protein
MRRPILSGLAVMPWAGAKFRALGGEVFVEEEYQVRLC